MAVQTNIFVSLKGDYNAVGDGITDDTQAVKKFLDYLADNGGVGIIEPGVYLSRDYVRSGNSKPFSLKGNVTKSTIFKNISTSTFFNWSDCDGIHIENITFDCQYSVKPPVNNRKHGLVFASCNNCFVENCVAEDFIGTGFMAHAQIDPATPRSTNIVFSNCYAKASQAFNDWKNATDVQVKKNKECNGVLLADCDYSKIINCVAEDISLFGIEIKNYSRWNQIINCRARNCVYGFGMGQQTTGDVGCERNLVKGFQSENCYMGCLLGKSKYNIFSDFQVDFTGQDTDSVRNAFYFQFNSRYNSVQNLLIAGLPSGKPAVRYESGSNNNVCIVSFCEGRKADIIVAEYTNSNGLNDTTDNYTVLYKSSSAFPNLKVIGDAAAKNKTRYEWEQSNIAGSSHH